VIGEELLLAVEQIGERAAPSGSLEEMEMMASDGVGMLMLSDRCDTARMSMMA